MTSTSTPVSATTAATSCSSSSESTRHNNGGRPAHPIGRERAEGNVAADRRRGSAAVASTASGSRAQSIRLTVHRLRPASSSSGRSVRSPAPSVSTGRRDGARRPGTGPGRAGRESTRRVPRDARRARRRTMSLPVTPGIGASPGGIDVGEDHHVGVDERVGEVAPQRRRARVAVRLEHARRRAPSRRPAPAASTAATSPGMVRVVVDERDAADARPRTRTGGPRRRYPASASAATVDGHADHRSAIAMRRGTRCAALYRPGTGSRRRPSRARRRGRA